MKLSILGKKFKMGDAEMSFDPNAYPWPIESDSIELVDCQHYLHVVPNLIGFMQELYRICKHTSTVRFVCPYYTSVRATANPESARPVSEHTFAFFDKDFRKQQNMDDLGFDFKFKNVGFQWSADWNKKSEEAKEFARVHYMNVIEDVMVEGEVVKTKVN